MAFTYDISTDRGKVRLGVGDTNEAHGIFTDDEIDEALSEGGSVEDAIVWLLKMLKGAMAARGDYQRVGAIDEAINAHDGDMPEVQVTFPAPLPMDAGWDSSDP